MSIQTSIGKALGLFFDNIRAIIALTIVTGSFGFLFSLTRKDVPVNNKDVLQTATGLVLAALGAVGGYYFGSSKNESDAAKATQ